MREIFIYYRVPIASLAATQLAVQAFQQRLQATHLGLVARLLRRPNAQDDFETWMETYAMPLASAESQGVNPELQTQIEAAASAMADLLPGPRHIEVFEQIFG